MWKTDRRETLQLVELILNDEEYLPPTFAFLQIDGVES